MNNNANISKKIVGLFHYFSCEALEYFPDVDHINRLRAEMLCERDDSKSGRVNGSGVPRGGFGVFKPPEILKALQNRAKLNPIVKTVKNC